MWRGALDVGVVTSESGWPQGGRVGLALPDPR